MLGASRSRKRLSTTRVIAALTTALGLGTLVGTSGCPANSCFLKVCSGGDCRCSISSCTDGAAFDTKQNQCRCLKGFISIGGQCLTVDEANAYCGVGHHWGGTGCVKSICKPGDALDLSTGWCIPKSKVDEVAGKIGVQVGANEELGCPAGEELALDGDVAACVPLSQTCAADETWNGQACQKVGQCPTGATFDTALGQCVQYANASGGDEVKVNVAQWTYANYGPEGGTGTSAFCGAFAKKPWSFGVTEGKTAVVRVSVMLTFPDNEIAKGAVSSTAVWDLSGNPVPAKGAAEVDKAAWAVFGSLSQGGGRANAPNASTTVRCAVVNASKPQAVPATGGV